MKYLPRLVCAGVLTVLFTGCAGTQPGPRFEPHDPDERRDLQRKMHNIHKRATAP